MKDALGHDLTTESAVAATALDRTRHAILSHHPAVLDHLGKALAADPDCALANALSGLIAMTRARRDQRDVAYAALATARTSLEARSGTDRERGYVQALADWLADRPLAAAERLDATLRNNPDDTLALKLVHAIRFMSGDIVGMRSSLDAAVPALSADHPERGYALGCHAFALEETGDYRKAERVGRAAVDLTDDDAWGIHAVAHVFEMTQKPEIGISWVEAQYDGWSGSGAFSHHLYWHLALYHLERGDTASVLALYDRYVASRQSTEYRDIANDASLLMRLCLENVAVGNRWQELSERAATRVADGLLAFADLHYLMALSGAGKADLAAQIATALQSDHGIGQCPSQVQAARAAAHVAAGLMARSTGNFTKACRHFSAACPDLQALGGSRAQRDVFERLAVDAAARCGDWTSVAALVETRARPRRHLDRFSRDRLARIPKGTNTSSRAATSAPNQVYAARYVVA